MNSPFSWPRTLALAAAAGAVLIPAPAGPIVLVAAVLAWFAQRPSRRSLIVVGPLLALAAVLAILGLRGDPTPETVGPSEVDERVLEALDREAAAVAEFFEPPGQERGERLDAFRTLEERSKRSGRSDWGWMLLDPDSAAFAWAGRGLVHEFDASEIPATGRIRRSGYTAETWAAVRPLGEGPRPWRVLVGRSWSIGDGGRDFVAAAPSRRFGRLPSLLLGIVMVSLGVLGLRDRSVSGQTFVLFSGGVVALANAIALAPAIQVSLIGSLFAVLVVGPRIRMTTLGARCFYGGLLAAVLAVSSAALQTVLGPVDLGSRFLGDWSEVSMRLAVFLLALGLLPTGPVSLESNQGAAAAARRWAWAGFAALFLGAAVHTNPWLAFALLAVGSVFAVLAVVRPREFDVRRVLLAGLLAALAWETMYHLTEERMVAEAVERTLSPPTQMELDTLDADLNGFFESHSWDGLVEGNQGREVDDLAFAIWRASPLAKRQGLSSLIVEDGEQVISVFAFGLPTSDGGAVDYLSVEEYASALPGWEETGLQGAAQIRYGANREGLARYWFLPRPGFRESGPSVSALAAGLLRDEPDLAGSRLGLEDGIRFGLYGEDGRVLVPPWKGAGNLSLEGREPPPVVETPLGKSSVVAEKWDRGWRVGFVPVPGFVGGFERIATHALSPLLLLSLVLASAFLSRGLADVTTLAKHSWRSYSRRMLILYTVLLMVPVILISAFVLRMLGQRIQGEQRVAGEAALESVQRILGDYVLTLDPGFGIDTTLDDDLLLWLSDAVHHEVNLYWGSQLYASSKRELFAAGILPKRIPGEIYSRLALGGSGLASRTSRAQATEYREFYAPLVVPDVPTEAIQLFVSMPLLAQEEEAQADIATLRRRVLLVAIAMALLLLAFGRRFVSTFTEPVHEIIAGTQRIARGAPAIGYKPADRELATLTDAIDRMAGHIAEGRASLLREKEVVDRIVDNITAGVVSVDREGRVLLLNRTAHDLLGLSVGEPVVEGLRRQKELAAVADFVETAPSGVERGTARLGRPNEEPIEWSLVWVPIETRGELGALFVIEDVTEVLRAQRLEAWAEMARIIAHEVKNPLTPIRLSTEHLREIHRTRPEEFDQVFEQCTENILAQVEELRTIAGEFSTYSRIPEIKLVRADVGDSIEKLANSYRSSPPAGVKVLFERDSGRIEADFDERLLGRAVRNLIENALRAVGSDGQVDVSVRALEDGQSEVRVADDGPGVAPDLLPRIFEPYFSTEENGTGLGLAITRKIAEEHGGRLLASNRSEGGLQVLLRLPPAAQHDTPSGD